MVSVSSLPFSVAVDLHFNQLAVEATFCGVAVSHY